VLGNSPALVAVIPIARQKPSLNRRRLFRNVDREPERGNCMSLILGIASPRPQGNASVIQVNTPPAGLRVRVEL